MIFPSGPYKTMMYNNKIRCAKGMMARCYPMLSPELLKFNQYTVHSLMMFNDGILYAIVSAAFCRITFCFESNVNFV